MRLVLRNACRRSFMKTNEATGRIPNATLEDLVAELTAAAYFVALRHGPGNPWLDLELELWRALTDVTSRWNRKARDLLPIATGGEW
jgi:hypothetical protein